MKKIFRRFKEWELRPYQVAPLSEEEHNCETGQKMWDPMTVFNAIEGNGMFRYSTRGLVTVSGKGETFFTPSASGNIRYQLTNDAAWNADKTEPHQNV